eukprot:1717380-Rhodomonas_salina.1
MQKRIDHALRTRGGHREHQSVFPSYSVREGGNVAGSKCIPNDVCSAPTFGQPPSPSCSNLATSAPDQGPAEQECELWVSKISEAAQWGRTSELTQSVASSHKSFEQMYMWDEDQSTMFSQEESSFARSMSPSTQRPHSVAPTPHFEQQPHLARKLQYSQEAATGSDSVGGLGVSVIMHQTGYPLVVELDPLGPAAQSKQIFPGGAPLYLIPCAASRTKTNLDPTI